MLIGFGKRWKIFGHTLSSYLISSAVSPCHIFIISESEVVWQLNGQWDRWILSPFFLSLLLSFSHSFFLYNLILSSRKIERRKRYVDTLKRTHCLRSQMFFFLILFPSSSSFFFGTVVVLCMCFLEPLEKRIPWGYPLSLSLSW